jgi:5,10-methylenetetrahydromethanopterin reductase
VTGFGFMMGLSPREPIGRFGDLARAAEAAGFEAAWLADSQLYTKNVYVALALAAQRTQAIRIGPGVTNPVTRDPTVTASAMAALAEVSGGRAQLGIGSGDAAVFPLGLGAARIDALRRAVLEIRAIGRGEPIERDGRGVEVLTGGAAYPILIAASQPRMLRLAGEVADGVILMGAANPELTRWQLEHVAAGAATASRTLDDVTVDLWFTISLSEDRDRALADVRPWALSQARWFHRWKELPDALRPWQDEFRVAAQAHDFGSHLSRHADGPSVSDEFVDWIGVAGDLDRCVEKIRPLLDLKVDRITFALLPGGRLERLQRYGAELLPALRTTVSYEER